MILNLSANEFLRLTMARGTTVEVLDGRVWITEAGRERDALVFPGMHYSVAGNGLVVVGTDAGAADERSRIAVWPPVWRWLRGRVTVILKRFAERAAERHAIGELERLSDRGLRDIGLTRDQIETAARRY
ncbi:MAG: DUF2917 domain-containing protein [Betaproteobacteria bacterium]|nr:DUF2917 domain-containing protein [Betaproteobacteria bacterium]